jgi:uncharacterized membrane protein
MDMLDGETEVRDYGLERLMMLSDGVFAIAMTLLALDLRPDDKWDHTLAGLWGAIGIPFIAFFWSFFAAAIFWTGHRRQFGAYRRADAAITFFNLVLLGEIILLPAATRILTEMKFSTDGLTLYLGLFALIGCTNAANWIYAAFFTDYLRAPRPGPAAKSLIAVILIVMPVGMTALGVLSNADGLHWLLAVLPFPLLASRALRAGANAIDRRLAE